MGKAVYLLVREFTVLSLEHPQGTQMWEPMEQGCFQNHRKGHDA